MSARATYITIAVLIYLVLGLVIRQFFPEDMDPNLWFVIILITSWAYVTVLAWAVLMGSSHLPKAFYIKPYTEGNAYYALSWFASGFGALILVGYIGPLALVMLGLYKDEWPLESFNEWVALMFYGIAPVLVVGVKLVQIIGDGKSGIIVAKDAIALRKLGHYGWLFKHDDVKKVEVIRDNAPYIFVEGKGARTDLLIGSMLPDAHYAKLLPHVMIGVSGLELYEELRKRDYPVEFKADFESK